MKKTTNAMMFVMSIILCAGGGADLYQGGSLDDHNLIIEGLLFLVISLQLNPSN